MAQPISFLKDASKGKSVLVGAPSAFDFLSAIREAQTIKCALAFGHMSGWHEINAALNASSAKSVTILLGQAFFQTEPDLLDRLTERQQNHKGFQGRLAPATPTFHPKVWLIETRAATHGIVGSANLSRGGFLHNVECSAYLNDPHALASLDAWFSELWKVSSSLTPRLCALYREQYGKANVLRARFRTDIDAATEGLEPAQRLWKRDEAIQAAHLFFKTPEGKVAATRRRLGMEQIRQCLKPPTFKFSEADWLSFLAIPEFGSLNRIDRKTTKCLPQIRKAFLHLSDDQVPLAKRIDDVVPRAGKYHVDGIGKNIVTKVLALLNPEQMPVYNERVERTLIAFGYPLGTAQGFGAQYSEFCEEAGSFARECGFSEVLSIDSFFEYYSRKQ